MYRHPGHPNSILGDFELVVHKNRLHLFHLCLPNHDLVAHLVSDDGLTWTELPVALRVGDPGEFDDDQIWTMGIFRRHGRFFMLYTGKKLSEHGRVERTCLATSQDLIHWKKYARNPVAEPDPRWYVAANTKDARIQWRDPHILVEDGVMHAIVAAGANDGPLNFCGCAGYFTSTDGRRWEVKPPLYRLRLSYDFEVPCLFKFNGKYYLNGLPGSQLLNCYRVADRLEGPWRRPAHDRLIGDGNYAYRPVQWRGKTYLMSWLQHGEADWAPGVQGGRVIVAPREVAAGEGDEIYLKSFSGWAQRAKGTALRPRPGDFLKSKLGSWGEWSAEGQALRGMADCGYAFRLLPEIHADFIAEITIEPRGAREFGLAWRSDSTADLHTAAVCHPAYAEVSLVRHIAFAHNPGGLRWRGSAKLMTNHFDYHGAAEAGRPGQSIRLRVVASGPYIEVSLNDRLMIVQATMSRRSGHIGVFVADGAAQFSQMTILPITPPHDDFVS
ncbi:MAG: hypothetical protein HY360_27335 [Verrucomicrobia bacterium]|nr:hypothetical protein [Verrucomicrobiota bacterium]